MTLEKVLLFIGYTVKLQAIRLESSVAIQIGKLLGTRGKEPVARAKGKAEVLRHLDRLIKK